MLLCHYSSIFYNNDLEYHTLAIIVVNIILIYTLSYVGSYGSMARFRSVSRVRKVTDNCVVASSGDYADFQYMERILEYLT